MNERRVRNPWTPGVFLALVVGLTLGVAGVASAQATETLWLSSLDVSKTEQSCLQPHPDRSVMGKPMTIAGRTFARGLGTHALSRLAIVLNGGAARFQAFVGVDDDAVYSSGSVVFRVVGDGRTLWKSPVMRFGQPAQAVDVDLTGVKSLLLAVGDASDGINCDHADWADARFLVSGARPRTTAAPPPEPLVVLTPKPPRTPRINGARIFGVRPGHPFLFTIPATGQRPMTFAVDDPPPGLKVDPRTGQITGRLTQRGTHAVTLRAENALGKAAQTLRIVCGDTLALTPHMGWNSWYIWADQVTDRIMREAADAMVSSGLIDHGYMYVNMDDSWTAKVKPASTDPMLSGPARDASGNILPNRRFPDMKALADYIHGKGLKAGIYTGPVPVTCAGHAGCFGHEEQDARRYAGWGFDFLKEDSCDSGNVPRMGAILQKLDRDVILNVVAGPVMAQAGSWGRKAGAHSWRTGNDLGGLWIHIVEDGFGLYGRNDIQRFSGPGGWNDPDYLCLGYVAGGVKTTLTPNQQYSYVSLWTLIAAPLIYSGDITRLDEFTLGLLTNDEVIEVDQDPLGQAAPRVAKVGALEVWVRNLEDGRKAVGVFNLDETQAVATVRWADLGISGRWIVRDLWRQSDLGTFEDQFSTPLGEYGVRLVILRPAIGP
jgi:alpha-galactosidase